jgi:hypothetical protein
MATTITDLYEEFDAGTGSEGSERTIEELRELWHASDLTYGGETPSAFWILVFGREGDTERWADGGVDWPTDEQWQAFRDALAEGEDDC